MSIHVMAAVWALDIPGTEKLVLLALADWSNDHGECWPSMDQLAHKSGLTDRAVRSIIGRLCARRVLVRNERPGKGVDYLVKGGSKFPPEQTSPRNETTKTPERRSANTPRHIKGSEAKASSPRSAAKQNHFPKPDWADEQVWSDFMENRRAKNLRNTATAYKGFLDDIARLSSAEWPPGRLLEYAVRKGWGGIYEPKDQGNGRQQQQGNSTSHPNGKTGAALERVLARYDREDEARGRSIVPFAGTA